MVTFLLYFSFEKKTYIHYAKKTYFDVWDIAISKFL